MRRKPGGKRRGESFLSSALSAFSAKERADSLERQFGQRPVIFLSNGYEHQIWDDTQYPPRPVQGFYKKDELKLLIQRRTTRAQLSTAAINSKIADRYYQSRAIRRIAEHFERDRQRRALLVMATPRDETHRDTYRLFDLQPGVPTHASSGRSSIGARKKIRRRPIASKCPL